LVIEYVLTHLEEGKPIKENVSFKELRTSIGRSWKTYTYIPQLKGYLRYNFSGALSAIKDNIFSILEHVTKEKKSYKFSISADINYIDLEKIVTDDDSNSRILTAHLASGQYKITPSNSTDIQIKSKVQQAMTIIETQCNESHLRESGFSFINVVNIRLNVFRIIEPVGSSYLPLSGMLKNRNKCISNVKNDK